MAGVYKPTKGIVTRDGNTATIFDLGLGFNLQATGLENIKLVGLMRGLTSQEVSSLIPEVLDFARIGEFIYEPIYTYSNGMKLRLAFSIAIQVKSDILLIDEIFGAGDEDFRLRAQKKIDDWVDASSIFVLASHAFDLLEENCTDAIWMEKSKVIDFGPVKSVINSYKNYLRKS